MHTLALAVVLSLGVVVAQTGANFDVVSVKPHAPAGDRRDAGVDIDTQPGGRLTIKNASLRMLVTFAYRVQDDQVVGGDPWTATDRFDIAAKAKHEATTEELFVMLRPVLRERFNVTLKNATRDLQVYALTVRAEGKPASQRKPSDVDCTGLPGDGSRGCAFSVRAGSIRGRGMPMRRLAAVLSQFAGRIVVDRTGVDAPQDFDLTWTPEFLRARQLPPGQTEFVLNGVSVDPNGPSLFTALQEQLNLKLESTKAPVDVLVIDQAEKPTAD